MNYSLFISCPKGLEYLLEEELKLLGLRVNRVSPQGVYGEGDLATVYHLCLWSRLANRVQLILFTGQVHNQATLYQLCRQYPWQTVFSVDKTIAVEFHGSSNQIRNSMFGAQVVKDGIVDHCRELSGARPTIDRDNPNIRLQAYLKQDQLTLSLDLTGYSLHQRGYRTHAGPAPLKENIAAAMLLRMKWPELAAQGFEFHDPFCGAGTLVIEAAMMAANIAPALIRTDQSFIHWTKHQASLWEKIKTQALHQIKPLPIMLQGSDSDARLIQLAKNNAERAGVTRLVEFHCLPLTESRPKTSRGLLLCNPPYGERLGEATQLIPLYQQLGVVLHTYYQGWQAGFLTNNPLLAKATGLRSTKQYTLYNGSLECKLYVASINAQNRLKTSANVDVSSGAQMFKNRLQKNLQHLQKWAKRNQISCYRVYDADLPEYAFAIDQYNNYVVLQEYVAPHTIPAHKTEKRSLEVMQIVPEVLGIPPDHLIVKQRKPQKGREQYQKVAESKKTMIVQEGKAKFRVNLFDYLDTGLFLDHRPLRLRFAELPSGMRFLNCFCYTAAASVHPALNGVFTTNVDLSNTYLQWAQENFKLNHLDLNKHQFIQSDCLTWLKKTRDQFDVIFLDPPSFSNSKRMLGTLDIQRDHEILIRAAMRVLRPEGLLYFSTNARHFKLASSLQEEYQVQDITAATLDLDFKRNSRIHQCFLIQHRAN